MANLGMFQNEIDQVKQIVEGKIAHSLQDRFKIYSENYNKFSRMGSTDMLPFFEKALEDHMNKTVIPVLREKEGESLLREFREQWDYYERMVSNLLHLVFFNLTREHSFILTNPNEVARRCFLLVVSNEDLRNDVKAAILGQISKMRESESPLEDGSTVLKSVMCMLWDFGKECYEDFDLAIFESSQMYYSTMSNSWICECSCQDYMVKVFGLLMLEKETIAVCCVHESSRIGYLEMVENELIDKHESQLVKQDSDCHHPLLRNDKMDDLSEMFKLFNGIDRGIQLLANIFRCYVVKNGTLLVKHVGQTMAEAIIKGNHDNEVITTENDKFVNSVIQLHQKYLQCVEEYFENHCSFKTALVAGFQTFCNEKVVGNNIWEVFVTHCDTILTNMQLTNRNKRYLDVEDALEKVSKIFPFFYDKDMVAEFYRKKLADRLLSHASLKTDYEESMLAKLKYECGKPFTHKMDGMVNDWALRMKIQSDFEEYLNQNPLHTPSQIEFSVTVLTSGLWPSFKSPDSLVLPIEMVTHLETFNDFYRKENMKRRLTWNHALGTCILIGRFDEGEIEIVGTTCQASALLLFNEAESPSFSEVRSQLNIEVEDTKALLNSIACSKYKILSKIGDTQSVIETDCFTINAEFSNKKGKIRLPAPKANVKENDRKVLNQDRRCVIDASIVRIMKRRQKLSHKELVMHCIDEVKDMFRPDMKEIKKRIEILMDREYMERDKENPAVYKYLA